MKTDSGFEFKVLESSKDDYELVEMLASLKDNSLGLPEAIRRLIGEEGRARLKEHCRDDKGIVSAKRMTEEMLEIMRKAKAEDPEVKN